LAGISYPPFHSAVAEDKTQITIGLTNEHSWQRQSEFVTTSKFHCHRNCFSNSHLSSSNHNCHFSKSHLLILSRSFFVVLHPIETADHLRSTSLLMFGFRSPPIAEHPRKYEHLPQRCY
jgi:hypothetical protein